MPYLKKNTFAKKFTSLVLTSAVLALGSAATANAQSYDRYDPSYNKTGIYANLGFGELHAENDYNSLAYPTATVNLGDQEADILTVTGRLGFKLIDYLAIEGEAGFGVSDDDFQRIGTSSTPGLGTSGYDADVDMKVKSYGGVFARGILPIGDKVELFARGGYGVAKAQSDITGNLLGLPATTTMMTVKETYKDIAYGGGVQYNINHTHGLRLDYTAIGDDVEIVTASYAINF